MAITTINATDKISDSRLTINDNFSECILKDGTIGLTANWDVGSYKITAQELSTDTISEEGTGNGVTIDGVVLKDNGITASASIIANGGITAGANIVMGDNSITGIDTLTFTDTAGTIAGIQNQNLLDKSASETISGEYTFSIFPITPSAAPDADYEVANKKYVDDNIGATTLVALTDTPANYTGAANKLLLVNGAGNAVEFGTTISSAIDFDTTVPTCTAGAPSGDNDLARKAYVDGKSSKYLFVPPFPTDDGNEGTFSVISYRPVVDLADGSDQYAYCAFQVPADRGITSVKAVWACSAASGNLYWHAYLEGAASGEGYNTHQNSDASNTTATGGANLTNVTTLEVISNLSAGDYCGVRFRREASDATDTLGQVVWFYGLLVEFS